MGKGFRTTVNSETIRRLRLGALLTQRDLAERSGVSRVTISKYESQGGSPSPLSIRKIAEALDADPRDLVTIKFE
jgi:transcriptional regulator with XRE-family HTH domain